MTAPQEFDGVAWADAENAKAACVGHIEPLSALLARLDRLDKEVGRLKSKVAYLEGALP